MLLPRYKDGINCSTFLNKKKDFLALRMSRLEKVFSMGINGILLVVRLGEDKKCSTTEVGLDLL